MTKKKHAQKAAPVQKKGPSMVDRLFFPAVGILLLVAGGYYYFSASRASQPQVPAPAPPRTTQPVSSYQPTELWLKRAYEVDALFHEVYTPCWEGAYGAIGDAYLFATTNDSSLLQFHLVDHDMRQMCTGTWVDDRAWIGLAEMQWWEFTGRKNQALVEDTKRRYLEARNEGRLSSRDGFWSWYNYPPGAQVNERIFTNSNMNQMASVACWLYEATHEKSFLNDALLVWRGDGIVPGVLQTLYKGNGKWVGLPGLAAFGKQLPWDGIEYCSIASSLYRATRDKSYLPIIVATAKRVLDPANGWVDPKDFFQTHMDGNGAFVNYALDAYMTAPTSLPDIPMKVEKMLEHVWTNHGNTSTVTLHRESDNGIRNGWNTTGGEDGYGVNEIGTVHAQGEAARAFGIFAYVKNKYQQNP